MSNYENRAPLYNWLNQRGAGLLLHLSSLPSATGIGNLGSASYEVVDFIADSRLKIWQMCPLGPTGFGDSPYQCFSAFAGNPYFIDLEPLVDAGLLKPGELKKLQSLPTDHVDYGALYEAFWPLLKRAQKRFTESGADSVADYGALEDFRSAQSVWLEDYALFMALKAKHKGVCWLDWPAADRDPSKVRTKRKTKAIQAEYEAQVFYQYLFYAQLAKLRHYAGGRGVEIMGDIPIFVALDSSDVWANQNLFQLDSSGRPLAVAGVPPDYFSDDGQLWGNPLFDWEAHQASDFEWWLQRIRSSLDFYDIVRIDHFRGFESYWSVPADAETAKKGHWVEAPGHEFFRVVRSALPEAKIVAEDLGIITKAVRKLLAATGLPGMAVLQFAFGDDEDNAYLPHKVEPNTVIYSGTHDNDTSVGWYSGLDESEKDTVRRYLSVSGEDIAWDLIRAAFGSPANLAIIPLQDFMNLGSEGRLNRPGSSLGNWQWRYGPDDLAALRDEKLENLQNLVAETHR
ncbi:MAG: 4-alpha-glucanotransferase [Opitutales bacterium]